ncbi:MAG: hypothetical protein H6713_34395 [Myxococcales bacterium]|nr:hypothetical protein [Myxococcales bacterium]
MPSVALVHRKRPLPMSAERYTELVATAARERGLAVEVAMERRDEGALLRLTRSRLSIELRLSEGEGVTVIETAALRWPRAAALMRRDGPDTRLIPTVSMAALFTVSVLLFIAPLVTAAVVLVNVGFLWAAVSGRRTHLLSMELLELLGSANGQALVRFPIDTEDDAARAIDGRLRAAARVSVATHALDESRKIVGTLRRDEAEVHALVSGRPCVYYELYVFESRRRWRGWDEWEHVGTLRQRAPFFVEDDSGRVRVNPTGARISTLTDAACTHTWDQLPAPLRAMIEHSGVYSESALRERRARPNKVRLRIEEGALEEGERVAVLGHAIDEPDPDGVLELGGYRGQTPERRCLVHADRAPLLISDNPSCLNERI